ncbi:MAG: phosphodiester glycosidase family protein [Candidatus Eisenbacteria bacterium]|nr:phosphodiester glycosidase family protein [Candidatus Eisenbacteria bacterium]
MATARLSLLSLAPWLITLGCLLARTTQAGATPVSWDVLAPGLEVARLELAVRSGLVDAAGPTADIAPDSATDPLSDPDSQTATLAELFVLRIDPAHWQLELATRSEGALEDGRTAREWAEAEGFVATINAGMYATDYVTNVGYLHAGDHVNNGRVNAYESVAAFGLASDVPENLLESAGATNLPEFHIFDLDDPDVSMARIRSQYEHVVQNLRLIKRPGENRWNQQPKRWCEAALGEDAEGRCLFLYCRAPLSMYDLNEALLSAGIGLVAAQHLDGGPPSQLFVRMGDTEVEFVGGAEVSRADGTAWLNRRIPNVIGVRPR